VSFIPDKIRFEIQTRRRASRLRGKLYGRFFPDAFVQFANVAGTEAGVAAVIRSAADFLGFLFSRFDRC
jgi:hypothetical protein